MVMEKMNMNKKKVFKIFFKRESLIHFINLNKLKYKNANIIINTHSHNSPSIKRNNIIDNKK